MQQPGMQQPGMQQPGMQQPGMQQPGMQQPGMQQPGMQQPGMQQPGMQQPGMQQPGMQQPGTSQPETPRPGSAVQQPGMQGGATPSLFGSAAQAPVEKAPPETPPQAPPEAPVEQPAPGPTVSPGLGASVGQVKDMRVSDLPDAVQEPAAEMEKDVKGKRGRFRWFAYGAVAAAAIGFFAWLAYYQNTTLEYAKIEGVQVDRDPLDPDTVIFSFTSRKPGRIGFIHGSSDKGETERFGHVSLVGKKTEYRWRLPYVPDNEPFRVRSLEGWSLVTQECRVQTPRPGYMAAFTPVIEEPGDIVDPFDPAIAVDDPAAVDPTDALAVNADMASIRIQLDWNDEAIDLDAHLEGPVPGGDRFSVSDRDQTSVFVNADVVRVDASGGAPGGPESIDVLRIAPGVYRCFVHDWTNRADGTSTALTTSGAQVMLECAGGTYRFTPPEGEPANLWEVFALEVTDDGVPRVRGINEYRADQYDTVGLYDYRTRDNRSEWITNYGGSEITERTVADGLDWLARHQGTEGFWSSETMGAGQFTKCKGTACRGEGRRYEVGQSGLALLAFQAGGHYYFNGRKYTSNVKRGLDWLVSVQRPDGALVSDKDQGGHSRYHTYYMYDHGIATFALADACASARATGQQVDPRCDLIKIVNPGPYRSVGSCVIQIDNDQQFLTAGQMLSQENKRMFRVLVNDTDMTVVLKSGMIFQNLAQATDVINLMLICAPIQRG